MTPRPPRPITPLAVNVLAYIIQHQPVTRRELVKEFNVQSNRIICALINIENHGTLLALDGKALTIYEKIDWSLR